MRFAIRLISAKPFMVEPEPIVNSSGLVYPILERDTPYGKTESGEFTVMRDGRIVAGHDRRDGWAYSFEWWTHNMIISNNKRYSGSIIKVTEVEETYARSYETHVLVDQPL